MRRGGIWNLAFKHHGKISKLTEKKFRGVWAKFQTPPLRSVMFAIKLNFTSSLWFSSPGQRLLGAREKLSRRVDNRQKNFFLRHSSRFSNITIWRFFLILISTQHLQWCQKVGWISQLIELVSVNKMYVWYPLSYNLTWPDKTIKSTIEWLPLWRVSDWPPRGRIDSKWYSSTSIMEEAIVFFNPLNKYKWLVH